MNQFPAVLQRGKRQVSLSVSGERQIEKPREVTEDLNTIDFERSLL